MESKTLIILTPGFPEDENDSTCLPSQQLFVRIAKETFPSLQIKVAALHYPYHGSAYQWHDIDVYPLNGKSMGRFMRWLLWLKCYRLLKKLKTAKTLGIISFWCNETALIGNFFARRNKIVHKIWVCGQDAKKDNHFVNWIKPDPSDLVAMSDFLAGEFFRNHGIQPAHIIPNAVAPALNQTTKDIDVIGAGSLIPLKQYNIFIDVVAELQKSTPAISAVLFGRGPEERSLRKTIIDRGLEKNIAIKGEADHDTLMQWMNRAKVLVHPSTYEGYSTVCLEALANGCHVVSFTYAENASVTHWHIVKDRAAMVSKVNEILKSETDFSPVENRKMDTTVKEMISLFEPVSR